MTGNTDIIKGYTVLGTIWKQSHMNYLGTIGIVALHDNAMDTFKAYIAPLTNPVTEETDTMLVCKFGAKLTEFEARAFFPNLDHLKYKT